MGRHAQAQRRATLGRREVACHVVVDDVSSGEAAVYWSGGNAGETVDIHWGWRDSLDAWHFGVHSAPALDGYADGLWPTGDVTEAMARIRARTANWVTEWSGWFNGGT